MLYNPFSIRAREERDAFLEKQEKEDKEKLRIALEERDRKREEERQRKAYNRVNFPKTSSGCFSFVIFVIISVIIFC